MEHGVTSLERAFCLARSGRFRNVSAIKKQLYMEGYDQNQITGRSLLKQIYTLCRGSVSLEICSAQQKQA